MSLRVRVGKDVARKGNGVDTVDLDAGVITQSMKHGRGKLGV